MNTNSLPHKDIFIGHLNSFYLDEFPLSLSIVHQVSIPLQLWFTVSLSQVEYNSTSVGLILLLCFPLSLLELALSLKRLLK